MGKVKNWRPAGLGNSQTVQDLGCPTKFQLYLGGNRELEKALEQGCGLLRGSLYGHQSGTNVRNGRQTRQGGWLTFCGPSLWSKNENSLSTQ